ncbi:MBL fold metallo-hydrolase [Flavobacteriaceae bacterium M23B6Z8]
MKNNAMEIERGGLEPQVVVLRVSNLFIVNYNYLVIDHITGHSILIDPAWEMDKIERAIADSHTRLQGILLTHSHFDHLNLAKPLADKYNCPIWMSEEEIAISNFNASQLKPVPQKPWWEGHLLIRPLLTPGHSPGSTCYLIGNNLFSGDTLFAEGCGLCPNLESAHQMFESLQHIKDHLQPDTRIFPGHHYGKVPGQEFASVFQNNIYLQFKNKNDFASYRLRKGQDSAKFFEFS